MTQNYSNVANFLKKKHETASSGKLSEIERYIFTFLCDEESFKKVFSMVYSAVKSGNLSFPQSDDLQNFNSNELEILFQQYSKQFNQLFIQKPKISELSPELQEQLNQLQIENKTLKISLNGSQNILHVLSEIFPNEQLSPSFLKQEFSKQSKLEEKFKNKYKKLKQNEK
jgi:hypothetical protein